MTGTNTLWEVFKGSLLLLGIVVILSLAALFVLSTLKELRKRK